MSKKLYVSIVNAKHQKARYLCYLAFANYKRFIKYSRSIVLLESEIVD